MMSLRRGMNLVPEEISLAARQRAAGRDDVLEAERTRIMADTLGHVPHIEAVDPQLGWSGACKARDGPLQTGIEMFGEPARLLNREGAPGPDRRSDADVRKVREEKVPGPMFHQVGG